MPILTFVLSAMALLAPSRDHATLGNAIASRLDAEDALIANDRDKKKTAALVVAVAFRESSLRADVEGDHDDKGQPQSFCAFQIYLPNGARTQEGWSGADLTKDAVKCVTVGMRLLRRSVEACPAEPIAVYASGPRGCHNKRAQRISRDRVELARRLEREVRP